MSRRFTCSVCHHPERGLIDEKLAAKVSFREIAERFKIGRQSLVRHSQHENDRAAELARQRIADEASKEKKYLIPEVVEKLPEAVSLAMSPVNNKTLESPATDDQKLFISLVRKQFPQALLVDKLRDLLNARRYKFVMSNGRVSDVKAVPDSPTQLAALELILKQLGLAASQNTVTETLAVELTQQTDLTDRILDRLRVISTRRKTE